MQLASDTKVPDQQLATTQIVCYLGYLTKREKKTKTKTKKKNLVSCGRICVELLTITPCATSTFNYNTVVTNYNTHLGFKRLCCLFRLARRTTTELPDQQLTTSQKVGSILTAHALAA